VVSEDSLLGVSDKDFYGPFVFAVTQSNVMHWKKTRSTDPSYMLSSSTTCCCWKVLLPYVDALKKTRSTDPSHMPFSSTTGCCCWKVLLPYATL